MKVVGNVFCYYGSLSNPQSMWNADAAETSTLVLMAVHSNYPGAGAQEGILGPWEAQWHDATR